MITYDPLMLCDDLNWLIAEIERLKADRDAWKEEASERQDAFKLMESDRDYANEKRREAERKVKAREAKIHDLLEFQEGLERMIAAYKDQVKDAAIALAEKKTEIERLKVENDDLRGVEEGTWLSERKELHAEILRLQKIVHPITDAHGVVLGEGPVSAQVKVVELTAEIKRQDKAFRQEHDRYHEERLLKRKAEAEIKRLKKEVAYRRIGV